MKGLLISLIAVPFLGAFIPLFLQGKGERYAKRISQILSFITFALSWAILGLFDYKTGTLQLLEEYTWVPSLSINFVLAIDGFSVFLLILTTLLVLLVSLQSPFAIKDKEKYYYALILFFEAGILGVFTSFNLILFYIFWEVVLIPMFFLIGYWGGPRRRYAALKFFIFTHVGSVLMLLSFFVIFANTHTFSVIELMGMEIPTQIQTLAAIGIFIGAAVKLPVVPIHTWLPDAHVEAPSPVSVLLAGLLLKMAGYAFIRLGLGVVPEGISKLRTVFLVLGVVGAFYAAWAAIRQTDIKRLIAFTSINHMSLVLIAVAVNTQLALIGAVFQMISHGLIIGLMFFLSGIIQHNLGTREISKLGYIRKLPTLKFVFVLGSLAAFGAPPMSGFIAEMFIYFEAIGKYPWLAVAAFSIVFTVAIYLWMLTRVVFTTKAEESPVEHLDHRTLNIELIIVGTLLIPIIMLGIFPKIITQFLSETVSQYII